MGSKCRNIWDTLRDPNLLTPNNRNPALISFILADAGVPESHRYQEKDEYDRIDTAYCRVCEESEFTESSKTPPQVAVCRDRKLPNHSLSLEAVSISGNDERGTFLNCSFSESILDARDHTRAGIIRTSSVDIRCVNSPEYADVDSTNSAILPPEEGIKSVSDWDYIQVEDACLLDMAATSLNSIQLKYISQVTADAVGNKISNASSQLRQTDACAGRSLAWSYGSSFNDKNSSRNKLEQRLNGNCNRVSSSVCDRGMIGRQDAYSDNATSFMNTAEDAISELCRAEDNDSCGNVEVGSTSGPITCDLVCSMPFSLPEIDAFSRDSNCRSLENESELENFRKSREIPVFRCPFDICERLENADMPSLFSVAGLQSFISIRHSESKFDEPSSCASDLASSTRYEKSSASSSENSGSRKRHLTKGDDCDKNVAEDNIYKKLRRLFRSGERRSKQSVVESCEPGNSTVHNCRGASSSVNVQKSSWKDIVKTESGDVQDEVEIVSEQLSTNECHLDTDVSLESELNPSQNQSTRRRDVESGDRRSIRNIAKPTQIINKDTFMENLKSVFALPSNSSSLDFTLNKSTNFDSSKVPNRTAYLCRNSLPLNNSSFVSDSDNSIFAGSAGVLENVNGKFVTENSAVDEEFDVELAHDVAVAREKDDLSELFTNKSRERILSNGRKRIEGFNSNCHNFQFSSEFDSTVDSCSTSENAVSPCAFVCASSERFSGAQSRASDVELCSYPQSIDRLELSCGSSRLADSYPNGDESSMDDSNIGPDSCTEFESFASPDVTTDSENVPSSRASASADCGVPCFDSVGAGLSGRRMFNATVGSHPMSCEEPLSPADDGSDSSAGRKKTTRRSRLLNEIANSDGYLLARKGLQHSNDSLFRDSKFLSREERALQTIHMQMTRMEVQEELTKLKKSKDRGDLAAKSSRATGKINAKRHSIWSHKFKDWADRHSNSLSKLTRPHKLNATENICLVANGRKSEPRQLSLWNSGQAGLSSLTGIDDRNTRFHDMQEHSQVAESLISDSNSCRQTPKIGEAVVVPVLPCIPPEVRRVVVCHNSGETVLHKAARLGYKEVALWCCQSGYVDVNATDNAGYTPLHETCLGSQISIARYLLYYGADVDAVSGVDGRRPLHDAVETDCLEMVRLLLSAGADIELTTYSGRSVHELAKSQEMKNFLKAYLCDLNGLNNDFSKTEWEFTPAWFDALEELGSELLADVPEDDTRSEELYFECCPRPFKDQHKPSMSL